MNCPPSKRPRRLNDDLAQRSEDPFGDDEDFTQDDLDEIDVIASQAFPQGAPSGLHSKVVLPVEHHSLTALWLWSSGEDRAQSRPMVSCTFGCSSRGMPSRDSLGRSNTAQPSQRFPQKFGLYHRRHC